MDNTYKHMSFVRSRHSTIGGAHLDVTREPLTHDLTIAAYNKWRLRITHTTLINDDEQKIETTIRYLNCSKTEAIKILETLCGEALSK